VTFGVVSAGLSFWAVQHGSAGGGGAVGGGGAAGGGGGGEESGGASGTSIQQRGEFVRAECRDGPGGARRRLLKRDEPLGTANCCVKFYTNRKVAWQGKGRK